MSDTKQPRLLSFTLDGWTVLGGQVTVSLVDGVAVLVGRNGAGKSAILEGFEAISNCAIGRLFPLFIQSTSDSIPSVLEIQILTPTERLLRYRYELIFVSVSNDDLDIDDNLEEDQFSFNDCCQYVDGQQEILWKTEQGIRTLSNNGDQTVTILGTTSSLRPSRRPENSPLKLKLPQEMQWVYDVLRGIRFLGKIPVRKNYRRSKSSLRVSKKGINTPPFSQIDRLSHKIFRMKEEELNELQSICQRMSLGSQISIEKFILSKDSIVNIEDEQEYIAEVLLDSVNIGLLSDGTVRILSILVEIMSSSPSVTTIIEEPETQIHPGMLAKLLNEIQAYTYGENLIISTHSPQVVSWTKPDKINLVYRDQGRTTIRKLQEEEITRVVEYLCEEGNLGEWIYSGIIDEDE